MLPLWLLVVVPPLFLWPMAKDPFRLPKLLLAEWLAIASLVPLAWTMRRLEAVRWRDLWRQAATRAALPLAAVATIGLVTSSHPLHVREGLADLWIGAACLIGWSAALPAARLERLLVGLLWPATAVAAIGILQFHGVHLLAVSPALGGTRYAITSTAGNTGDLAAFLVLPCLIAQWRLARGAAAAPRGSVAAAAATGRAGEREPGGGSAGRWAWLAAALVLCAYAIAVTQTLAALVALMLGSLIFWAVTLGRGSSGLRWLAAACVAAAILAAGAVVAVPALRGRVLEKVSQARRGDWNHVLTGRLDGWRAALWMLARHPWAGVGQGAYRAEFVPAKLALLDRGTVFLSGQQQNFANAHDEALETGADLGVPGLVALAWGLAVVAAAARRRGAPAVPGTSSAGPVDGGTPRAAAAVPGRPRAGADGGEPANGAMSHARRAGGAFAAAGLAALGLLCLVDFPFRVALVAFPALLFLAWVLRPAPAEAAA
jgi:O-antigen ligase